MLEISVRARDSMKSLWLSLICISLLVSIRVSACDTEPDLEGLLAPGGYVYISETPLQLESGEFVDDEMRLVVKFHDCRSGEIKVIDDLPFLAAAGKVHAVFFIDKLEKETNKLVVLHSVEIRADTGICFKGNYYSVHVFHVEANKYIKDAKALHYFGYGGDIVNNYEENHVIYRYPYKTEFEVRAEIASKRYNDWMTGEAIKISVNQEVPLYSDPVEMKHPVDVVERGITVTQKDAQAGWIKVSGKHLNGRNIIGWIKRDDLSNVD